MYDDDPVEIPEHFGEKDKELWKSKLEKIAEWKLNGKQAFPFSAELRKLSAFELEQFAEGHFDVLSLSWIRDLGLLNIYVAVSTKDIDDVY